ncbi:MAG: hypothetical protein HRT47_03270 [Candidatus Caenarcaniphilales bacterium]|nr:hypothetical protein [Candidatus Caenarcaniphilales bacterium]
MNNLELRLRSHDPNTILEPGYVADDAVTLAGTGKINEQINKIEENPALANTEDNLEFNELKKKAHGLAGKLGMGVPGLEVSNANSIFDELVMEASVLTKEEKAAKDISDSDLHAPHVEDKSTEKIIELEDTEEEIEETVLDEVLTNIVDEKYDDTFSSKKQIIDQLKSAYNLEIAEPTEENADEMLELAIYEADIKENAEESEERELVLQ